MSEGSYKPIKILDVDLSDPLPDVSLANSGAAAYGGIFCLVRSGGVPIGVVEFPAEGESVPAAKLRDMIEQAALAPPATDSAANGAAADLPAMDVIVATRDRTDSLVRTLESLLRQSHTGFSIIVADSAPSSNETAETIASRYGAADRVKYVRDTRPGLGRAHNAGMSRVTAQAVAFTDDDVIADRNWLAALAANFTAGGKVGCVTGLIMPAELETRAQLWTERHGGFGKGFQRKVYDMEANRPKGRLFPFTAGQFGSGANMAFSTRALRAIGGFDNALGAGTTARGGDDLAAFYAVINHGYQLVYEPGAIVWHHHRRSEDGMERQAFNYGMGLGAYLTKVAAEDPRAGLRLMAALPAGLVHMLGRSSPKNQRLPADYPGKLVWQERRGIAAGVAAYFRSRAEVRRADGGVNQESRPTTKPTWQG